MSAHVTMVDVASKAIEKHDAIAKVVPARDALRLLCNAGFKCLTCIIGSADVGTRRRAFIFHPHDPAICRSLNVHISIGIMTWSKICPTMVSVRSGTSGPVKTGVIIERSRNAGSSILLT